MHTLPHRHKKAWRFFVCILYLQNQDRIPWVQFLIQLYYVSIFIILKLDKAQMCFVILMIMVGHNIHFQSQKLPSINTFYTSDNCWENVESSFSWWIFEHINNSFYFPNIPQGKDQPLDLFCMSSITYQKYSGYNFFNQYTMSIPSCPAVIYGVDSIYY